MSPSILLGLAVLTLHRESDLRDIHVPSSAKPTCFVVISRIDATDCRAPGRLPGWGAKAGSAPGPFLNARYGSYIVGMGARAVRGGGWRAWKPWLMPSAETVGSKDRVSFALAR